jgi:integrase
MGTRSANGRSSLYQDSKGRWHGVVSMGIGLDGRLSRRHVSGSGQTEVSNRVRELERQRDASATATTGRTTLSAWMSEWIARREQLGSVRPLTVKGYRTDERNIVASIGGVRMAKLGPAHIEHLWNSMVAKGLSVAHCRRTLTAALNDAVDRGLLARNPVKMATTPRSAPERIDPYTVEQTRRLLDAAQATRNAARWTVALALGMRQGEVLGLRWDDIDLAASSLTIRRQLQRIGWRHGCTDPTKCTYIGDDAKDHPSTRGADCPLRWGGGLRVNEPKSDAGRRTVTLPPSLTEELRSHRAAQAGRQLASEVWTAGPDGGWVFANDLGGPTDPRADARDFKELCRAAKVPAKRLHDLRHTAATMMLDSDLDLRTAGQVLGHSQVAQTARYSHVLADRKSVAAARIEATMFGHRKGS